MPLRFDFVLYGSAMENALALIRIAFEGDTDTKDIADELA
jgi:hypothetical protein